MNNILCLLVFEAQNEYKIFLVFYKLHIQISLQKLCKNCDFPSYIFFSYSNYLATFTFAYLCSVEEYLFKIQTNKDVGELVLNNQANLKKMMSSEYCEVHIFNSIFFPIHSETVCKTVRPA